MGPLGWCRGGCWADSAHHAQLLPPAPVRYSCSWVLSWYCKQRWCAGGRRSRGCAWPCACLPHRRTTPHPHKTLHSLLLLSPPWLDLRPPHKTVCHSISSPRLPQAQDVLWHLRKCSKGARCFQDFRACFRAEPHREVHRQRRHQPQDGRPDGGGRPPSAGWEHDRCPTTRECQLYSWPSWNVGLFIAMPLQKMNML